MTKKDILLEQRKVIAQRQILNDVMQIAINSDDYNTLSKYINPLRDELLTEFELLDRLWKQAQE